MLQMWRQVPLLHLSMLLLLLLWLPHVQGTHCRCCALQLLLGVRLCGGAGVVWLFPGDVLLQELFWH
jgi:hypothetical protein